MGVRVSVRRPGLSGPAAGGPKRSALRTLSGISGSVLAACIAIHAQAPATVKDKVYTKDQATRGEKVFTASCAKCHKLDGPETKDGPPLGGDVFLTKWDGKPLFDVAFGIKLNMPPDGSVILDDAQTADIVAFILKSNGFLDGAKALTIDATKTVTFVKAK